MKETQRAAAQYEQLEGQRSGFQITFAVIFILVAMLFLVAAVAIGIHFATQLADPDQPPGRRRPNGCAAAILPSRVPEGERDDELASLSRAFNRMTDQIQSQQSELIEANRQLDERRRFTETVLTGVSAGVIGLDRDGRINLPNRSASALLGVDLDQSIGEDLAEVVPEMAGLLDEAERRPDRLAQAPGSARRRQQHAHAAGAHRRRARRRRDQRLCRDLRRHHRAAVGAAQGGLGRRRAPHRPRDQEPADPDPALGRAAAPQLSEGDQERSRDLRDLHRHDHPPCRATSAAWSTSSRRSRGCRRRC